MHATIDKAGRVVLPKRIREQVGLVPGPVEVTVEGAGVRIEAVTGDGLAQAHGRLVIPATGAVIDDETVRDLRDAGQR